MTPTAQTIMLSIPHFLRDDTLTMVSGTVAQGARYDYRFTAPAWTGPEFRGSGLDGILSLPTGDALTTMTVPARTIPGMTVPAELHIIGMPGMMRTFTVAEARTVSPRTIPALKYTNVRYNTETGVVQYAAPANYTGPAQFVLRSSFDSTMPPIVDEGITLPGQPIYYQVTFNLDVTTMPPDTGGGMAGNGGGGGVDPPDPGTGGGDPGGTPGTGTGGDPQPMTAMTEDDDEDDRQDEFVAAAGGLIAVSWLFNKFIARTAFDGKIKSYALPMSDEHYTYGLQFNPNDKWDVGFSVTDKSYVEDADARDNSYALKVVYKF